MNVGFIGLGVMGSSMAKNLLKKGHSLTVLDINTASMQSLVDAGAQVGGHAARGRRDERGRDHDAARRTRRRARGARQGRRGGGD